ncbi:MAG: FmdB family zinc ribbon protein [Dehalococcoidia bacterium]
MPIYEYLCRACQWRFELLRPMSANGQASCPQCGEPAQRVLSLFAAVSRSEMGESAPVPGTGRGCSACSGGACACAAGR